MDLYLSPEEISGGLEFMERHTRALRWVVGMFTHWSWTPAQVAATWRFLALRDRQGVRAIACHQAWSDWWGLVGRDTVSALAAYANIAPLGSMRHLEGEEEHLEAMLEADSTLRRRVMREERSVVLHRSTADFELPTPPGFLLGEMRHVPALQAYHQASPGPGRQPSVQELKRQLERSAVFVLEVDGEVVALGKAVPGGSHSYIRDIYTFPEQRRKGYGRQLMVGILGALADRNRDACLCVADENQSALDLYLPMGFETWGRRLHLTLRPTPVRDEVPGG